MGDFRKIVEDFKPLFDVCDPGTYSVDETDFQNNLNALKSVLSSWLFYLTTSAGQNKNDPKVIDFKNANCSPKYNQQKFDLIIPTSLTALDLLKASDNSYLLTSLILTGLTEDQTEKELYNMLKKVVQENLTPTDKTDVLNNIRSASVVLLTLNTIASAHYQNLLKKFLNIVKENAERLGQANKELAVSLTKQIGGVRGKYTGGKKHKY